MCVLDWILSIHLSDPLSVSTIPNQRLSMSENQLLWEMISQAILLKSRTFALIAIDAFRPVSISKELVAMDGSMIKSVATPLEHLVLLLKMSALNVDNVLTDAQLEPLLKNQKLNRSLKPSKTQRKK